MALPSNVDHGTVVGFFEDSFGNALAGSVTFIPQFTVARDASATPKTIILPSPVTATLTQGAFSVLLVATDDADLGLTTWNYRVVTKFTGPSSPTMDPFNMFVPMGVTTDLADVITVPSASGVQITKGDKGDPGVGIPTGGTTGQALVKASDTDYDTSWATPAAGGGTGTVTSVAGVAPDGTGDVPLTASDVSAVPNTRTVAGKALSADVTLTAADVGADASGAAAAAQAAAVAAIPAPSNGNPSVLGATAPGTGTAYARWDHVHKLPTAADVGAVPITRTVAGKPLSANVTLAASDVGAVPTTRTVNGMPLSADVALAAADVGAQPAGDYATNTALAAKYTKPGTGIPSTDMTAAVQTSLGKADAALPASGTAAAATKLATARTINGQAFDGTANVVIAASDVTTGQLPYAVATTGTRFTVLSTTVWPARPSSRTDIYFDWIDAGGLGTDPPGWLDGDSVLKAS